MVLREEGGVAAAPRRARERGLRRRRRVRVPGNLAAFQSATLPWRASMRCGVKGQLSHAKLCRETPRITAAPARAAGFCRRRTGRAARPTCGDAERDEWPWKHAREVRPRPNQVREPKAHLRPQRVAVARVQARILVLEIHGRRRRVVHGARERFPELRLLGRLAGPDANSGISVSTRLVVRPCGSTVAMGSSGVIGNRNLVAC